jgi:hypothetical protein
MVPLAQEGLSQLNPAMVWRHFFGGGGGGIVSTLERVGEVKEMLTINMRQKATAMRALEYR